MSRPAAARYRSICSNEETCNSRLPVLSSQTNILVNKMKSINWSYSFPVQLTPWTNFILPTISPILLITGRLYSSSGLTSYFSNDLCSFPKTLTVFSLNNINQLLSLQLHFSLSMKTLDIFLLFSE